MPARKRRRSWAWSRAKPAGLGELHRAAVTGFLPVTAPASVKSLI
jgi:hypothetical protein